MTNAGTMRPASSPREKLLTRRITIDGFRRADGLWDIEGHLLDVRHHDTRLLTGLRAAGTPFHEMLVCLTFDSTMTIVAASAETLAAPYPGACERITPDYARLTGLCIEAGFRREVGKLFGGVKGCTHLTEMLGNMATVAFQTVRPETDKTTQKRPGQLDGCHALDISGPTVAHYYPTWHRKPE